MEASIPLVEGVSERRDRLLFEMSGVEEGMFSGCISLGIFVLNGRILYHLHKILMIKILRAISANQNY